MSAQPVLPKAGAGGRDNEADMGRGCGGWELRTLAKPLSLEKKKLRPREVK